MKKKPQRYQSLRANLRKTKKTAYTNIQQANRDARNQIWNVQSIKVRLATNITGIRNACKAAGIVIGSEADRVFTEGEYQAIRSYILSSRK